MKNNTFTEFVEHNNNSEALSDIGFGFVWPWLQKSMSYLKFHQKKNEILTVKNTSRNIEEILINRDYKISILNDYSRLDEIYRLTHDTFVSSGEILPQDNGMIVTCPHLDTHPNTIILIAEQNDKIIGTITATIDSEIGLNIEKWFEQEVNEYKRMYAPKLGSSWRLATVPSFRGKRELIVDLIGMAFNVLLDSGCDICLCALMSKHKRFYQRLMGAKVLANKSVSFNKDIPMELNLMEINLESGWNKFKRLKKSG